MEEDEDVQVGGGHWFQVKCGSQRAADGIATNQALAFEVLDNFEGEFHALDGELARLDEELVHLGLQVRNFYQALPEPVGASGAWGRTSQSRRRRTVNGRMTLP
jgi:hypothetical protein